MFKTTINTIRNGFNYATSLSPITQTRNATKRAAGSRTNKNDSAGRRLGPKVFEGNFVSPGQIIMRQRGTKIHPGENCGIGKDHTIFALEPGYVRFYYDPFHPLRKYVGIALKKDVKLPKPHFEPRLRRFGYVEIVDEHEALKEQNRMSRKEYLQQNDLKKTKEAKIKHDELLVSSFTTQLPEFVNDLNENELKLSTERLLNTYKLTRLNESIEFANDQSTFNYIIDIKHKLNKNEINESEFNTLKQDYYNLIEKLDSKVTVDYSTKQLTKYLNPTERLNLKQEILDKLSTFKNKIISKQDKSDIENLIATPLVFNKFEKNNLTSEYLPSILPESITDTVFDPENSPIPEGGRIIHRYNNSLRRKVKIGRTKEAFVSEL